MSENNIKMNAVAKILTDRDLFGKSMGISKILDCTKVKKSDKAEILVFLDDIKKMRHVAYEIFCERMGNGNDTAKAESMNEYNDSAEKRNELFKAVSELIDDIGTVGQAKLINASFIYNFAVMNSFKFYDEYHGKALTVKSQIVNDNKALKDAKKAPNGINAEYISTLEKRIESAQAELDELKKKAGMVTLEWGEISDNPFVNAMDKMLCKLAKNQLPKSLDEIKAEKKAQKDENNAKKANAEKGKGKNKNAK